MTQSSLILGLPYIQPSQAQKHVTHNEALRVLDALVQLVVVARDQSLPPAGAAAADRFLVAAPGQGAWAGHDNEIAVYDGITWTFVTPQEGWSAYVTADGAQVVFDGTDWLARDITTVDSLGINASSDLFNRLSVSSDAVLLNHAGSNHQLKINKAAATDTGSLLFQTGFSGRAEMGISGNDDFSIKVSANGSGWAEALRIEAATGVVTLPQSAWREMLSGPRTYYVDPAQGSDAGDGLSAGAGAFASLAYAVAQAQTIDAGGHAVTIQLADGTYNFGTPLVLDAAVVGAPRLVIEGNLANPDQVVMAGDDEVFEVTAGVVALRGMRLQNTSGGRATVAVSNRGTAVLDTLDFGVAGGHLSAVENGSITLEGPCTVSGNAKYFVKLTEGGSAQMRLQTVTLTGTPHFASSFIICARCSVAQMSSLTFAGSATGRRYLVSDNAVITTNGGGASYFPGDVAGTSDGGGRYD